MGKWQVKYRALLLIHRHLSRTLDAVEAEVALLKRALESREFDGAKAFDERLQADALAAREIAKLQAEVTELQKKVPVHSSQVCRKQHHVDQSYGLPDIIEECALPLGHGGERHETATATGAWWEEHAPPCVAELAELDMQDMHRLLVKLRGERKSGILIATRALGSRTVNRARQEGRLFGDHERGTHVLFLVEHEKARHFASARMAEEERIAEAIEVASSPAAEQG